MWTELQRKHVEEVKKNELLEKFWTHTKWLKIDREKNKKKIAELQSKHAEEITTLNKLAEHSRAKNAED